MGRFADTLGKGARALRAHRRAQRAADKVKWPEGFAGTVMWCPLCYAELHRIPEGTVTPTAIQQAIVDAHRRVCPRAGMKAIPGGKPRGAGAPAPRKPLP